jgi:hypothetical protein
MQVTCTVTDRNGNPVADGTVVRFRIVDAGTNLPDGLISPAVATTTNGRTTATVTASNKAGLHIIEAQVFDAQGNPVLRATREIFFSGTPYRITLDTAGIAADPFRSAWDFVQREIFQHLQFQHTDVDQNGQVQGTFQYDNWYINTDPRVYRATRVDYRAQLVDQNLNPVPDGTTINFELRPGNASLSVTSATTQNGWTSAPKPLSYTGIMTGGTNRSIELLFAWTTDGLPATRIDTFQYIHIHDPNDGVL